MPAGRLPLDENGGPTKSKTIRTVANKMPGYEAAAERRGMKDFSEYVRYLLDQDVHRLNQTRSEARA